MRHLLVPLALLGCASLVGCANDDAPTTRTQPLEQDMFQTARPQPSPVATAGSSTAMRRGRTIADPVESEVVTTPRVITRDQDGDMSLKPRDLLLPPSLSWCPSKPAIPRQAMCPTLGRAPRCGLRPTESCKAALRHIVVGHAPRE